MSFGIQKFGDFKKYDAHFVSYKTPPTMGSGVGLKSKRLSILTVKQRNNYTKWKKMTNSLLLVHEKVQVCFCCQIRYEKKYDSTLGF